MAAIAARFGHDARTVKTHIERAVRESEEKAARQEVLRDTLQLHFRDLTRLATKIAKAINVESEPGLESKDALLLIGLRQHLPRSPLWGCLDSWHTVLKEEEDIKAAVARKLDDPRAAFPQYADSTLFDQAGISEGISHAMQYQLDEWARGNTGLSVDRNLALEPVAESGPVTVYYGATFVGRFPRDIAALLKEAIPRLEESVRLWREFEDLKKARVRLVTIQANLRDILNVIILRRVVPGRCRYCPY
jgi:hypothetical protein